MWFGGLDAQYRDALARSHRVYSRVDVLARDGTVLQSGLPFIDGSVQATLASRVARRMSLTVDRSWFPLTGAGEVDSGGLLAPFGNRLAAYRGITYGDGSVASFPAFYGRIEAVALSRSGSVALSASDLAADVVDAQFETPTASVSTNTVGVEFQRLVTGALSDAVFGTSDVTAAVVPPLLWQSDRAQALDDLSASVGMLWYPLADGSFVQRLVPWSNPSLASVLTLTDGTSGTFSTSNLISDYTITISRSGVYNSVVYASERLDGSAPVHATVHDLDPASPTYYLGNFGRKPFLVQNQAALTQQQCLSAANTVLKQATAVTQTFDPVTTIPDAAIELGDLLTVQADSAVSQQVVAGFTLPLREGGSMSLNLRAWAPVTA